MQVLTVIKQAHIKHKHGLGDSADEGFAAVAALKERFVAAKAAAAITKNEGLICQTMQRKISSKTGERLRMFTAGIAAAGGATWQELTHKAIVDLISPHM